MKEVRLSSLTLAVCQAGKPDLRDFDEESIP
jgi:hypothetical protein